VWDLELVCNAVAWDLELSVPASHSAWSTRSSGDEVPLGETRLVDYTWRYLGAPRTMLQINGTALRVPY
jgi:hypothetical protein